MNADLAYENLTLSLNLLFEELALLFKKKSKTSKDLNGLIDEVDTCVSDLSNCLSKMKIDNSVHLISGLVKSKVAYRNSKQINQILSEVSNKLGEPKTASKYAASKLIDSASIQLRLLKSCLVA
jgi:hypothetical protein